MRLPTLLLLACLAACSAPSPSREGQPRAASRQPRKGELRVRRDVAVAVLVGTVQSYEDRPAGRVYTVRVEEVLHINPLDEAQRATHPVAQEGTLLVTSFLFADGATREIGPLEELSRYLFFLAPREAPGEWLHLEDASQLRLPEAQEGLDELRRLRDKALAPGAPAGAGEPR